MTQRALHETRRLALGRAIAVTWLDDQKLLLATLAGLYRVDRADLRATVIGDGVAGLAVSDDRRRAALLVPTPRRVRVIDLTTMATIWELDRTVRELLTCVAITPDGSAVAWGEGDATVNIVDLKGARPPLQLAIERSFSGCCGIRWTPSGAIVTWQSDGVVQVWGADGALRHTWKHHRWVRDLVVLGEDRLALAANPDSATISSTDIHLWIRALDGTAIAAIPTPGDDPYSEDQIALDLERASGRLASVGEDARLHVVGLDPPAQVRHTALDPADDAGGSPWPGWDVAWSPDGRALAVLTGSNANVGQASYRHSLQLFGDDGERLGIELGLRGVAHDVSVAGDAIALAHEWGVDLHRGETRTPITEINASAIALSPDGSKLALGAAGFDGIAQVIEVASRRILAAPKVNKDPIVRVAFSPDGEHYAIAGTYAWLMKLGRKSPVRCDKGQRDVWGVAFSADGRRFAQAGWDGRILIAEAPRFRTLKEIVLPEVPGPRKPARPRIWDLAFGPGGDVLAVACGDAVRLVAVDSGAILSTHPRAADVRAVAWSGDGHLIADGSRDGELRIWEAASAAVLARFRHGDTILSLAFRADGSLVSAGEDGGARIFAR